MASLELYNAMCAYWIEWDDRTWERKKIRGTYKKMKQRKAFITQINDKSVSQQNLKGAVWSIKKLDTKFSEYAEVCVLNFFL